MMNIGIVGNGLVGSTAAYAIIMRGLGRKIVLVDKDKKRSIAETNDLLHAIPFANPLTVRQGNYEDLADCKLVVIAAGVSQKKGESRLDLLKRNADVFACVMVIHVQITDGLYVQVDHRVPGQQIEHVIQKSDPRLPGARSIAVQVDRQLDVGLTGLPLQGGATRDRGCLSLFHLVINLQPTRSTLL